MKICSCPAASALTTIPNVACAETFGQIQKVAFMRLKKADGTANSFVDGAGTGIDKLAAWTANIALTDGGKVVIAPDIQAMPVPLAVVTRHLVVSRRLSVATRQPLAVFCVLFLSR